MASSCIMCARCGALTRTWNGFMRFRLFKGQHRPTCLDEAACRARGTEYQWKPGGQQKEFWLDGSDEDRSVGPRPRKRAERNMSEEQRQALRERMHRINAERRAAKEVRTNG